MSSINRRQFLGHLGSVGAALSQLSLSPPHTNDSNGYDRQIPLLLMISCDGPWAYQMFFEPAQKKLLQNFTSPTSIKDYSGIQLGFSERTPAVDQFFNNTQKPHFRLINGVHCQSLDLLRATNLVFGKILSDDAIVYYGDYFTSKIAPHLALGHLYDTLRIDAPNHPYSGFGISFDELLHLSGNAIDDSTLKTHESFLNQSYQNYLDTYPDIQKDAYSWKLYKSYKTLLNLKSKILDQTNFQLLSKNDEITNLSFSNKVTFGLECMNNSLTCAMSLTHEGWKDANTSEKQLDQWDNLFGYLNEIIEASVNLGLSHRLNILVSAPYSLLQNSNQILNVPWPSTSALLLSPRWSYSKLCSNSDNYGLPSSKKPAIEEFRKSVELDIKNSISFPRIYSSLFRYIRCYDHDIHAHLTTIPEV